MAIYNPHQHSRHSSIDRLNFGYDAYENVNRPFVNELSDSMSRVQPAEEKVNIFIIFVFILELLVLVFVSVLEYFLRATDVFPIRKQNFTCGDPDISYRIEHGESTYGEFAYNANVSYEIIIPISFCVPPVIMLLCELAVWGFSEEPQKTVRALCRPCKLPQILRRIVRYIGTFLFGLLVTMIFVDVTKLFIGRLRPNFSEVCDPDPALCVAETLQGDSICQNTDDWHIRQARLSFPSLHAAVTAFAATFMAVYLHTVFRASSVRIMRPFLALGFMILPVMCSLARYGLHFSHWTDCMVGFGIGVIFAVYVCVFVLHNFRERMGSKRLYQTIKEFMFEQRTLELRDLYKEERLPYSTYPGAGVYAGGIILPRPHLHANGQPTESTTDDVDMVSGEVERSYHPYATHSLPPSSSQMRKNIKSQPSPTQTQNTFQRDLQRTIEHYRHNDFGHF